MDSLNFIFGDQRILEASSCKYLSSRLNWADQVNYTAQKAWKALEFIMRVLKQGNSKENLAYMSQVRPILEYGAWGFVLGSVEGRSDKRVRTCAKGGG